MKVYLSGGITGIPDARERFEEAKRHLLTLHPDWHVISPFEIDPCRDGTCVETPSQPRSNGHTWGCWLRHDLIVLLDCDRVMLLPGWQTSRGATLEVTTALAVGITVQEI